MKRYIKSSISEPILTSKYFDLVEVGGTGVENTPWKGLKVYSKGPAYKHVVEVRLHSDNPTFKGEPVIYHYKDTEVAHGMRGVTDTLEDTEEYIDVLKEAVDFAKRINKWLETSEYKYTYKRS